MLKVRNIVRDISKLGENDYFKRIPSSAISFSYLYHDVINNTPYDIDTGLNRLAKIEGNGQIVNQLVKNGDFSEGTDNWFFPSSQTISNNIATVNFPNNTDKLKQLLTEAISGHKYLYFADVKANDSNAKPCLVEYLNNDGGFYTVDTNVTSWNRKAIIFTVGTLFAEPQIQIRNINAANCSDKTLDITNVQLVDLTKEFGAGNEPTTITDKRIKRIMSQYRPFNEGTYKGSIVDSLETKGFNIWDEDFELGTIDNSTGQDLSSSSNLRSNYLNVIQNETYYFRTSMSTSGVVAVAFFYDENGNYEGFSRDLRNNNTFVVPNGYHKMRFVMLGAYGTTYNHDICINISGDRNGIYIPHCWQDFYQRVEYIESTGTQYIDTGVGGNTFTKYVFDFKLRTPDNISTERNFFGNCTNSNQGWQGGTRQNTFFYWSTSSHYGSTTITSNTIYNIKYEVNGNDVSQYINNQLDISFTQTNTYVASNFALFAQSLTNPTPTFTNGRIYSCKIYGDNTLVRNFIPVYRKIDGTIGLYDLVDGKFYTNAGTGTFLKGNDIQNDNIIQLPAPIQLDGAINSHNTFEVLKDSYKFTRNVFSVGLSSYTFTRQTDGAIPYFRTTISNLKIVGGTIIPNMICSKYQTQTFGNIYSNGNDKSVGVYTGGVLLISDNSYSDSTSFMNNLGDTTLTYELATPQVISIPKKHLKAIDLSQCSWSYRADQGIMYSGSISSLVKKPEGGVRANIFTPKYLSVQLWAMPSQYTHNNIAISPDGNIAIQTDDANATPTGYLFYETEDEVEDFINEEAFQRGGELNANEFGWIENQLVPTSDLASNFAFSNGVFTFSNLSTNVEIPIYNNKSIVLKQNHKYLVLSNLNNVNVFEITNNVNYSLTGYINDSVGIYNCNNDSINFLINIKASNSSGSFSIQLIDLTLAFGAGKEPNSIEDYRIQDIINKGYIPTNTSGLYKNEQTEVLPNVDINVLIPIM